MGKLRRAEKCLNCGTEFKPAPSIDLCPSCIEALLSPAKTKQISPEEEEEATTHLYELTTIVPYVEKPEVRVYLLSQPLLEVFLEGYGEYAEYLISLKPAEERREIGLLAAWRRAQLSKKKRSKL